MRALLSVALVLVCGISAASGALTLPGVISSHMVLQRDGSSVVWGWSDQINGGVTATLASGSTVQAIQVSSVAADGSWRVDFGKRAAGSGSSLNLTDGVDSVHLTDIAFGDVILCSGQSNMEFGLGGVIDAENEINDSIRYPLLRLFTVQPKISWQPISTLTAHASTPGWQVSGPSAFQYRAGMNPAFEPFSAVCYFAGRELYKSLRGEVPIGLVASYWGGSPVEAWSSPAALSACAGQAQYMDVEAGRVAGDPVPDFKKNNVLWNGMIHPLKHMRIKLVLWYQGEQNAPQAEAYRCRFPAMISDWRLQFGLPSLPFFFVQVAAYSAGGSNWPRLMLAQASAASALPFVYLGASAMDLGDPESPDFEIHPRIKRPIGERLARSVGKQLYGQHIVDTGPMPGKASVTSAATPNRIVLSLRNGGGGGGADAASAAGLRFRGTSNCGYKLPVMQACCNRVPFFATSKRGVQLPAVEADVDAGAQQVHVLLDLDKLAEGDTLDTLSYAHEAYPQCALYNEAGLPMTVFQIHIE